jgi:hypothetical protein
MKDDPIIDQKLNPFFDGFSHFPLTADCRIIHDFLNPMVGKGVQEAS